MASGAGASIDRATPAVSPSPPLSALSPPEHATGISSRINSATATKPLRLFFSTLTLVTTPAIAHLLLSALCRFRRFGKPKGSRDGAVSLRAARPGKTSAEKAGEGPQRKVET